MYVFMQRINDATTEDQLRRLTEKVLDTKFCLPFTEAPRLLSAEVLEIRDRDGCAEHHGLVCIQPEKAAEWFIKEIQKYELNRKPVKAREYVTRQHDRVTNSEMERRRKHLVISKVKSFKPTFAKEGMEAFRREYCA